MSVSNILKAVFPAAGLGTRFLPATKNQPKEMLSLYDKPAIQYVIEEAAGAGLKDILIIIAPNKRSIIDHFDRNELLEKYLEARGKEELAKKIKKISEIARLHYTYQVDPLGLGHAVLMAEPFIGNSPFAVYLADDIIDPPPSGKNASQQMIDLFSETGSSVIALEAVSWEKVSGYGVVDGKKIGERKIKITNVVEKPSREEAPSNLTIVGRYIFTPTIFELLKNTPPGRNGEIQLTDAIQKLIEIEPVYGLEFEGRRFDTGDPAGFLEATVEFALKGEDSERIRKYLIELSKKL